ncbi:MAG: polysaccharide deacetylase family protein [Polyangiaceae bacterium]
MRLAAVSVDLDELPNYFQIHGLPEPDGPVRTLVYDVAVARLEHFAKDAGIPLTLFAIGSDLTRPEAASALSRAHRAGHEIANHSLDHMYDLTRLERGGVKTQVEGGVRAILRAVGEAPVGFRAPGYTINDEVFSVLAELGVEYDSSVFPCPTYFAAKSAAIMRIAVAGRMSRSVIDDPRVLTAPTTPYRVGKPYWKRGTGLLELPIQVTRGLRLPFIGTALTLAGPLAAAGLTKMCIGDALVNLELHGIDVLERSDGLTPLLAHQPDVRISLARKLETLHEVVAVLKRANYTFVTLREAAKAFAK